MSNNVVLESWRQLFYFNNKAADYVDCIGTMCRAIYNPDTRVLGVLYFDEEPQNPRVEWDQYCRIYIANNRYVEGDTDDITELYDLLGRKGCDIDFDDPEWEGHEREILPTLCEEYRIKLVPLYASIHSNVAISTVPFNDRWDSGQIGWVWASMDDPNITDDATYTKIIEGEVREYDMFLQGDVYGIGVYDIQDDGSVDEYTVEEVWGFFGFDDAMEEMKRMMEKG